MSKDLQTSLNVIIMLLAVIATQGFADYYEQVKLNHKCEHSAAPSQE